MAQDDTSAEDLINHLVTLSHPSEDQVWEFVIGKIEKQERVKAISEHLSRCKHCMELATMFGWPASDTSHYSNTKH